MADNEKREPGELEKGTGLPSDSTAASHSEEDLSSEGGDEYTQLIRYIKTHRGDKKNGDDEESIYEDRRVWYAPWRQHKVKTNKKQKEEKTNSNEPFKVPDDWLDAEITQGLDSTEVERRRKHSGVGWNELTAESENMFLKFVGYFMGPVQYVMELAVLLAAGLRDWIDLGVIIGILALNATVGWYQEKQAADIVASLKADISMKAYVVREGKEQDILARELVPGDIMIIEEGQSCPADGKLICGYDDKSTRLTRLQTKDKPSRAKGTEPGTGNGEEGADPNGHHDDDEGEIGEEHHDGPPLLAADQSAITGESLAVDKYAGDTVYYTTGCKRGKAYAVVTATARGSFVGKTATMVAGAKDQGHFKAIMDSIGISLLVLVMAWILIAWIGGFFWHLKIATPEASSVNLLHYALILLIIGVPVGLPVVTTTTMAVGAAYLAKQKAVVQKLTAIESLAGCDVLCSDKTGTLTANQLSIREPYCAEGVDVNWLMAVAAIASSHNIKSLDPIDKVTITTLNRYPKALEILQKGWTTEKYTPFDPVSKRITCNATCEGKKYVCAKGAPNAILKLTSCSADVAKHYKDKATEFARRGFRSLGVAIQEDGKNWELLGMIPMFDPPRDDTAVTIGEAQALGINIKMLTGDAIAIAKETCQMLNLGTKVYNSDKLIGGSLGGSAIHDFVEKADGFAEVFPEHKYQVVEMLQRRGHLTAMTGDGVNDAPSLKKADCGIAVEGASEAAQAAADIVFLDPGLGTIIKAIKVARQIFHRMKAYIVYRIALCLHLEIFLVLQTLILDEIINTDLVVFLALFADLATVAVAYDNAPYARRPVEWQLPKIWIISTILGILLAAGTWILRATLLLNNGGVIQNFGGLNGILFLEISLTENWLIFVTRGGATFPSWQLVGAIFGVDVIATLFCVFGWLTGPPELGGGNTDIVTVVVIWAYSLGVTIVLSIVYYILNKIPYLDNLGRKQRNTKNAVWENILGNLTKVAIEHERDAKGDHYHFQAADDGKVAQEE